MHSFSSHSRLDLCSIRTYPSSTREFRPTHVHTSELSSVVHTSAQNIIFKTKREKTTTVQIIPTLSVQIKKIRKLTRTEDNSIESFGDNPQEQRARNIEETKKNNMKQNKTLDTGIPGVYDTEFGKNTTKKASKRPNPAPRIISKKNETKNRNT